MPHPTVGSGLRHAFLYVFVTAELRMCEAETATRKAFEIPYAADWNQPPTVVIQFNYDKNICVSLTMEMFVFTEQEAVSLMWLYSAPRRRRSIIAL
jgi:hypothetical protein